MPITADQLKKIIRSGEKVKIDFKANLDLHEEYQKKEFAKDVSAMANTIGNRGFLIFGVTNDRRVVGVSNSSLKETQMQQIIANRIDPPIEFTVYTIKYDGKLLGIVEIPPSIRRPHQRIEDGVFWIRRGTTSDFMTLGEIVSAIIRKRQIEKNRSNVYDQYGAFERAEQIKADTISEFLEYGFVHRVFKENYTINKKWMSRDIDVVESSKTKLRFYLVFDPSSDIQRVLSWFNYWTDEWWWKKSKLSKFTDVFALVSWSSIKESEVARWWYIGTLSPTVSVKIESSTTVYRGIGKTKSIDPQSIQWSIYQNCTPKFFLTKIGSREDVRTRIGLMLQYIDENEDIFMKAMQLRERIRKQKQD